MDTDFFFKLTGLLISVGGFVLIIVQLHNLDKSLKSSARGSIFDMAARVKDIFLHKPHLRKYFFGGVSISEADTDFDEVMAVADYLSFYLEQITTQKNNIAREERDSWLRYVKDVYQNSPALQHYLHDKKQWYSPRFWEVLE